MDIKEYCGSKGLVWDPAGEAKMMILANRYGMNREVVEAVTRLHIDLMADAFDPSRYSWRTRLWLASRFLFG
jgi:hypothetical protein